MAGLKPRTTAAPAAGLLDAASGLTAEIRRAEADRFALAAAWAEAHPAPVEDSVVDELGELVMYGDQPVTIAGEGAPGMAEFAIAEFGAAIGVSTASARAMIGAAVEIKYRLPQMWVNVRAGKVPVWKARRIAERTHRLTAAGAAYVDAQLAAIAGDCSFKQIDDAVRAAEAETDLERFEEQAAERWEQQHLDVHLADAHLNNGLVPVDGLLAYDDAVALENALRERAHALLDEHPDLDLDIRRAQALGSLADAATGSTGAGGGTPAREMVLYVHHDVGDPDASGAPVAEVPVVEGLGATTLDQIYRWCTQAGTKVTLRPVLDLDAEIHVDRYRPTAEQREQAVLTCPTCVFPGCGRSARRADLDHIIAYARGGRTTSWNLAPLCRLHHRLKTFGYWSYRRLTRTSFEWTSPTGRTHVVDLTRTRRRTR